MAYCNDCAGTGGMNGKWTCCKCDGKGYVTEPTQAAEPGPLACGGSTTHYAGCPCHEAEWGAHCDSLRAERDQLQAHVKELEMEQAEACKQRDLWRREWDHVCRELSDCRAKADRYRAALEWIDQNAHPHDKIRTIARQALNTSKSCSETARTEPTSEEVLARARRDPEWEKGEET